MYYKYINFAFVLEFLHSTDCVQNAQITINSLSAGNKYLPPSQLYYDKNLHVKTVPICCDGYSRTNSSQGTLRLVCEQSHETLNSTACECKEGYKTSENNTCEPFCSQDCGNGSCIAPDLCKNAEEFIFVSDCTNKCGISGRCVRDDICTCTGEYRIRETCDPYCCDIIPCKEPCINGNCELGMCLCIDGYTLFEDGHTCIPYCAIECGSGKCIPPGSCECDLGYIPSSSDPVCRPDCKNCMNNCKKWQNCSSSDKTLNFEFDGEFYCFEDCAGNFSACEGPTICLKVDLIDERNARIGSRTYVTIGLSILLIAPLVVLLIIKRHTVKNFFSEGSHYSDLADDLDELPVSDLNTLDTMRLSNLEERS